MTYTLTVSGRELEATEEQAAIIDYALGNQGVPQNLLINALQFTLLCILILLTLPLIFGAWAVLTKK